MENLQSEAREKVSIKIVAMPDQVCQSVTKPLLIQLQHDDDPIVWVAQNRSQILLLLERHSALVFRGGGLRTPEQFEEFANAICPELYGSYGDLPKKEVGNKIYKSTPYPKNLRILFHNEGSNTAIWPTKQFFFCEQPADVGGTTPLVDCREVYRRLPPEVQQDFETKGLKYIRNFSEGIDVSWQDYFKASTIEEARLICDRFGLTFNVEADGTVQTEYITNGLLTLPDGDISFFNQVQLHHPYCLEPQVKEVLLDLLGPEKLPRNVTYADGSIISDETMRLIGIAYETCAVRFNWRKGDVVLVDNRVIAHGRDEFEGERKVVVAMADMRTNTNIS